MRGRGMINLADLGCLATLKTRKPVSLPFLRRDFLPPPQPGGKKLRTTASKEPELWYAGSPIGNRAGCFNTPGSVFG